MTVLISSKEFKEHTENHINNVVLIAESMIDRILDDPKYRELFNIPDKANDQNVKKAMLDIIKNHDLAKINEDSKFLKENGLSEPLYKTFFKSIGKDQREYPELKSLIIKLNSIDEKIINEKLKRYPEWFKELTLKVEKFADAVERGCNYITEEELGRKPIKASEFLQKFYSKEEVNLIKEFENIYSMITNKYIPSHLKLEDDSIDYSHIDLNKYVINKNKSSQKNLQYKF